MSANYLQETPLLDFGSQPIQDLISSRGWDKLSPYDKIGTAYDYVRNEIAFGYNSTDTLPASKILRQGYGQCNTKTTLLMAILRGLGLPCRFHGFTIDKRLQRGVVPELVYGIAPKNIIHAWVEVNFNDAWVNLEGFILDDGVLSSLQSAFPGQNALCAYGAGTDNLQNPGVTWEGQDTYIQKTGINQDFGVFPDPDSFYKNHTQLTGVRGILYRAVVRHWMNRRVRKIRAGCVPAIPDDINANVQTTQMIGN